MSDLNPAQFFLAKPAPLMEFPRSLPRLLSREFLGKRQRELYEQACKAIDATQSLPEDQLSILQWYYKILEMLLLRPNLEPKLQSDIAIEAPQAAFNAIIADYSSPRAQVLELSLLPKAEYVCKLLLWANDNRIRLRYPFHMYYPTLYGDFYWAHYFHARHPTEHFYERLVKFNLDFQDVSASSILCLGCLNGNPTFTDSQMELLAQEHSIAFQVAAMFRDRVDISKLLFDASLKPQWAYHILTSLPNVTANLRESAMTALEYSPPWMLEYLVATKGFEANPTEAKELLERSLQSEHPMCDDMRQGLTTLL